jgi:hypothetical protein
MLRCSILAVRLGTGGQVAGRVVDELMMMTVMVVVLMDDG